LLPRAATRLEERTTRHRHRHPTCGTRSPFTEAALGSSGGDRAGAVPARWKATPAMKTPSRPVCQLPLRPWRRQVPRAVPRHGTWPKCSTGPASEPSPPSRPDASPRRRPIPLPA
jgi:hypothetical protein